MPNCPDCGSSMVLRTAKRGNHAGNQFWGCSNFPRCRGIKNFESGEAEEPSTKSNTKKNQATHLSQSVTWLENAKRDHWVCDYTTVGSIPFTVSKTEFKYDLSIGRALSQCMLLTDREASRINSNKAQLAISAILLKILRRGSMALTMPDIEQSALNQAGLLTQTIPLTEKSGEFGFEWKDTRQSKVDPQSLLRQYSRREKFSPSEHLDVGGEVFDSPLEDKFYNEILPKSCIDDPRHWITPQAPLDIILSARGLQDTSSAGGRRVDFLFYHPFGHPLVIEIDGEEHIENIDTDNQRDEALEKIGIKVLRITNDEIEKGKGTKLENLIESINICLTKQTEGGASKEIEEFILDCTRATQLQYAILKAVQYGWLSANDNWDIEITNGSTISNSAIAESARLMLCLDRIYKLETAPKKIRCYKNGHLMESFEREGISYKEIEASNPINSECVTNLLTISLEHYSSPNAKIPKNSNSGESGNSPDMIIRPAFLPVSLAVTDDYRQPRLNSTLDDLQELSPPLTSLLQAIFRKNNFREGQLPAIRNALCGLDSVVLLPTGAGKSIIYQLAGLLLPGVTITIDPLVALIEDQIDGLEQYGITRALGLSANTLTQGNRESILNGIEKGEYFFILMSPERLQSPDFRNTLISLSQTTTVNMAVIDEAHCVSEWGHDFRPSYLHLSRNLRQFCRDSNGDPPPLLALTGTASRAVLRDMLADLQVSTDNDKALIKPQSFDRKELNYEIKRVSPGAESASLRGIINSLPNDFGYPIGDFFSSHGSKTNAGIVFTRYVNGNDGLVNLERELKTILPCDIALFSGSKPKGLQGDWEAEKRRYAKEFKRNQRPLLIATKAFGMGIDKPNIRYTIHYGMPSSLESFYQEAGRAGRDRNSAKAYIIFSEFDSDQTDSILDPNKDIEVIREMLDSARRDSRDDATKALWFHLNSFQGIEEEMMAVKEILGRLNSIDQRINQTIPFDPTSRTIQEKAIYRLLQCGVIEDYTVDFGSRQFDLHILKYARERCIFDILSYIQSSQPGRTSDIQRKLREVPNNDTKETIADLVRVYITFTYEVIEKSRRRSLQESIRAARESKTDVDFRERILYYLSEGVGAETFQELIDKQSIDWVDWFKFLEKINNPVEAGEIRGISIRFLESYPDHPGLLIVRGLAESRCNDPEPILIGQSIVSACQLGKEKYGLSNENVDHLIEKLHHTAKESIKALQAPLAYASYKVNVEDYTDEIDPLLEDLSHENDTAKRIYHTHRLQNIVDKSASLIDKLEQQFN